MKTRLKIGDVIRVHNPLISEERALYPVLSIEGNRVRTAFRTFNAKVWQGKYVYEFGKRQSPVYSNVYTVDQTSGEAGQAGSIAPHLIGEYGAAMV